MRTVIAPISPRSLLSVELGSRSRLRIPFKNSRYRIRSTTRNMGEEQAQTWTSKQSRAPPIFMELPIISAAMRHWTRTISLRMHSECVEENSGAHNPVALGVDHYLGQRSAPFSSFPIRPHAM